VDALDRIAALYRALYPDARGVDLAFAYHRSRDGEPGGYVADVEGCDEAGGAAGDHIFVADCDPVPTMADARDAVVRELERRVNERIDDLAAVRKGGA
jgi:hypothetical protein